MVVVRLVSRVGLVDVDDQMTCSNAGRHSVRVNRLARGRAEAQSLNPSRSPLSSPHI
jgi:hypothetical protein